MTTNCKKHHRGDKDHSSNNTSHGEISTLCFIIKYQISC